MSSFINEEVSHQHSLETLNVFQEYDDFMESIDSVVDLGCGEGRDLEWWATRMTREDNPKPLNITCVGVDAVNNLKISTTYQNISFQQTNFEENIHPPKDRQFDILWSHDSFQYAVDPVGTLGKWWHSANEGGMLAIIVPQTTNIKQHKLSFTQESLFEIEYEICQSIIEEIAFDFTDSLSILTN